MDDFIEGEFEPIPEGVLPPDEGLEPRVPVVILADCSGSMQGEPMSQVNGGLAAFFTSLHDDPLAARRCEVAVVSFGGVVTTELDFTVVSNLQDAPRLIEGGETPMAEAIIQAASMVDAKKQAYRAEGRSYYRPWIFMFTDGFPTDIPRIPEATRMVHEGEANKRFMFFAVGCFTADMAQLAAIASPKRPPVHLDGSKFSEMFEWLSRSLVTVSSSNPGDQKALPPITGWGIVST